MVAMSSLDSRLNIRNNIFDCVVLTCHAKYLARAQIWVLQLNLITYDILEMAPYESNGVLICGASQIKGTQQSLVSDWGLFTDIEII